jgi:hypothetical protein
MSVLFLYTDLTSHKIGCLTFQAPSSMKLVQEQGIDSYVFDLIGENGDTIFVEYGKWVTNLYNPVPAIFSLEAKNTFIKRDGKVPTPDQVLFSEYPKEDQEQNIFDTNYYMYDTINNIVTKIVHPKREKQGIIGIYIPKLKNGNRFSMYSVNPDSATIIKSLRIFHTIKYND